MSVTKSCGTEFVVPDELKETVEKQIALVKECFDAKATDGKIVNAQAMGVYFDLMEKHKEFNLITDEEIEDMKSFAKEFQKAVDAADANNDGFIELEEFKALLSLVESVYFESLFSTFDINMDGFITQDEMNTVVAGIDNEVRAKRMRQYFDMMLANFDADKDGQISLTEFTESMKTLKY